MLQTYVSGREFTLEYSSSIPCLTVSEETPVSIETTKIDTTTTTGFHFEHKPYLEFKIAEIIIVSGQKVLAVNESRTNLRFKICAQHLERERCCKTKLLYSKYFTEPNGVATFRRYYELGTCSDFVVGLKSKSILGTNYLFTEGSEIFHGFFQLFA